MLISVTLVGLRLKVEFFHPVESDLFYQPFPVVDQISRQKEVALPTGGMAVILVKFQVRIVTGRIVVRSVRSVPTSTTYARLAFVTLADKHAELLTGLLPELGGCVLFVLGYGFRTQHLKHFHYK